MLATTSLALTASLLFGGPASATQVPAPAVTDAAPTTSPSQAPTTALPASEARVPTRPGRQRAQGRYLEHCTPNAGHCTRARAARLTLGLSSFVAAAAGLAVLTVVGDRLKAGDPGGLLMGMGALGMAGVSAGAIVAAAGNNGPGSPDRIRPATLGLRTSFAGTNTLGERAPGTAALRFGPSWFFPDGLGRLRLLGSLHGQLGPRIDVDPRAEPGEAFETGLTQRHWGLDVAADMAFRVPRGRHRQPSRHSGPLGSWELRWRPSLHVRRDKTLGSNAAPELAADRRFERIQFLPLTVGARWNLSARQRFTGYVGPRFNYLAYAVGTDKLARGGAQIGALYAEAWYDIDFPNLLRFRPPTKPAAKHSFQGQLSVGYIHSRFDGDGISVGGAKGFLGPAELAWRMKLRRHGKPAALLFGAGARLGSGLATFVELGVALPDLGATRLGPTRGMGRQGARQP